VGKSGMLEHKSGNISEDMAVIGWCYRAYEQFCHVTMGHTGLEHMEEN